MPMFEIQPGAKPYELTAQLLAAIAHPKPNDTDKRRLAAACLRYGYVQWLHARVGEEGKDHVRLEDAFLDPQLSRKGLRKLERVLRKRLLAGHMAVCFLKGADQDPPAHSLPGIGKLTVENVSAEIGARESVDPRNLRKIFSEATPVLHLVASWATLIAETTRAGEPVPHIYEVMQSPASAQAILERAKLHQALIDRSPSLVSARKLLVRF